MLVVHDCQPKFLVKEKVNTSWKSLSLEKQISAPQGIIEIFYNNRINQK